MIVRLIVFIAIFFMGWWLYRQFMLFKHGQSPTKNKKHSTDEKDNTQESMVRCEECKTFTPKSHAVYDTEKRAFCCQEHLESFSQKP